MSKNAERRVDFLPKFREDLAWWIRNDRKAALKTLERLVYRVTAERIDFLQARYHYE